MKVAPIDESAFHVDHPKGAAGVERKCFGSFTERAFSIEMIKIDAGEEWLSIVEGARRLGVVLCGTGTVDGMGIGRLAAIQIEAAEQPHVSATSEMVLYIVGLPPVRLPSTPSDQFDVIESVAAAALCRQEGIAESLYYAWSKEFLEPGKRRLAGDTARATTTDEVKALRSAWLRAPASRPTKQLPPVRSRLDFYRPRNPGPGAFNGHHSLYRRSAAQRSTQSVC